MENGREGGGGGSGYLVRWANEDAMRLAVECLMDRKAASLLPLPPLLCCAVLQN